MFLNFDIISVKKKMSMDKNPEDIKEEEEDVEVEMIELMYDDDDDVNDMNNDQNSTIETCESSSIVHSSSEAKGYVYIDGIKEEININLEQSENAYAVDNMNNSQSINTNVGTVASSLLFYCS